MIYHDFGNAQFVGSGGSCRNPATEAVQLIGQLAFLFQPEAPGGIPSRVAPATVEIWSTRVMYQALIP